MQMSKESKPAHALLSAVASSKLRLVRLLIEGGVHVDTRNDRDQTPLLITCSSLNNMCHTHGETRERVVKYLIAAKADVNACDITGRSPLICAVITRARLSVLTDLIDAGADPWWEDRSRKCAFDYAVQQQDFGQIQTIVDAYKKRMRGMRIMGDVSSAQDVKSTRGTTCALELSKSYVGDKTPQEKRSKNKQESQNNPKFHHRRVFQYLSNPSLKSSTRRRFQDPEDCNLRPHIHYDGESRITTKHLSSQNGLLPRGSSSSLPTYPSKSTDISEGSQLCELCKNIVSEQRSHGDPTIPSPECHSFSEYDFSGLLYRRRSTGSLFGLTESRYESIRRKRELGITMEDLFSSTDINQPDIHSLYVKSPRTNTLVDISANQLLVPDPDRARSASVSLPPLDHTRLLVRDTFCSSCPEAHFLASARSVPRYLASDDDDLLIIPASCMTSSSRSVTPSPDDIFLSRAKEESEACNSPLPTIVLTDYVNADKK